MRPAERNRPADIARAAHGDQSLARAASVDRDQQAFYARLAGTWWDTAGPFWPLHRLNALRVAWLRRTLASYFGRDPDSPRALDGVQVLDIGCGGGILSVAMAQLGATVHGIDVVTANIEVARHHSRDLALDLRYEAVTAEDLAARGARYDVVLCMEVVEHVADLDGFLAANATLVGDGGVFAAATINRTLRAWLFAIVGAEYVLGWLPRGTHAWRRFVRPEEIERRISRHGLRVTARTGVAVSPFTRRFRLVDDLGVNYMLVARKDAQDGFDGAPRLRSRSTRSSGTRRG